MRRSHLSIHFRTRKRRTQRSIRFPEMVLRARRDSVTKVGGFSRSIAVAAANGLSVNPGRVVLRLRGGPMRPRPFTLSRLSIVLELFPDGD